MKAFFFKKEKEKNVWDQPLSAASTGVG